MRLIDADLMQEKAYQMNFGRRINERELFLFNRALSEMPTIDAVPVVHGRFEVTGMFDDFLKCSVCGRSAPWTTEKYNYCPNFGARMDGKEMQNG